MTSLLIAEDQEWTRKGLREMIERRQLEITEVIEAGNGLEALDALNERKIDIVLTDIRMPGMDGLLLSQHIKTCFPDTQVVILSGFNDFAYAQQALRSGVNEYLLKPVQPELLHDVLSSSIAAIHEARRYHDALQQMFCRQLFEASPLEENACHELFLSRFEPTWKRVVFIPDTAPPLSDAAMRQAQAALGDAGIHSAELRQAKSRILLLSSPSPFAAEAMADAIARSDHSSSGDRLPIYSCSGLYTDLQTTWIKELESLLALHRLQDGDVCVEFRSSDNASFNTDDSMQLLLHAIEQHDIATLHKWQQAVFPDRIDNAEISRIGFRVLVWLHERMHTNASWQIGASFLLKPIQQAIRLSSHSPFRPVGQWLREAIRHAFEMTMLNYEKKDIHLVQWCQSYIIKHINEDISLSRLAEKLHFSPSHLSNLFKQVTGQNYIDFVSGIKIERAKYYFTETNLRVQDVACQLGYTDNKYFSKWFRRYVGLTPSEFKQKRREAQP